MAFSPTTSHRVIAYAERPEPLNELELCGVNLDLSNFVRHATVRPFRYIRCHGSVSLPSRMGPGEAITTTIFRLPEQATAGRGKNAAYKMSSRISVYLRIRPYTKREALVSLPFFVRQCYTM